MRQIQYPDDMGSKFRFIAVAALRCRQLQKGAKTRVTSRSKKFTTIAQEEVLAGTVPYSEETEALAASLLGSEDSPQEAGSAE